VAAVAVAGVGVGLAITREDDRAPLEYTAISPSYGSIAEIAAMSDVVVRGKVTEQLTSVSAATGNGVDPDNPQSSSSDFNEGLARDVYIVDVSEVVRGDSSLKRITVGPLRPTIALVGGPAQDRRRVALPNHQ
jgi:hypothetical protein